jgi:SAM-dependent methyltransferase
LRDYLVADVEDPRINVQSLLTRHFLIFGLTGRHQELAEQELRFAACLNWVLEFAKDNPAADAWAGVRFALRHGADNAEGVDLPHFLRQTFHSFPARVESLRVPNYLGAVLEDTVFEGTRPRLPTAVLNTFMSLWREVLAADAVPPCRVLEPACGSANDYRFLKRCGLAERLDYTGFDLCAKNVQNARALFPDARFEVGNVFEIAAADRAFDYAYVHDLFEHLSPAGLAAAAKELGRVTRSGLCLHFFNMDEIAEHVVRPVDEYHWNTLSLERVIELFAAEGFTGQAFHIGTFLRRRVGCGRTHNPNAYTLLLGSATA